MLLHFIIISIIVIVRIEHRVYILECMKLVLLKGSGSIPAIFDNCFYFCCFEKFVKFDSFKLAIKYMGLHEFHTP